MSTYVPAVLRRLVEERARACCEYWFLPADVAFFPHEVDHSIAEKHGGATDAANLAFTCWRCNRHKGTDLASLDPLTGQRTALFHPRTQRWDTHFRLEAPRIVPLTAVGRVTERLFQLNTPERIAERMQLIQVGRSLRPPPDTASPAARPDVLTVGDLISLHDAAAYTGLARGTLQKQAKQGQLRARKVGRKWMTTYAALDAYLQSRDSSEEQR